MKPDTEELLRKLELATSRGDVHVGSLDEETARLREGWLALESALKRSSEGLLAQETSLETPEENPAETPKRSLERLPATPDYLPAPIAPTQRSRGGIGWLLASALALCAAVFSGWYVVARSSLFQESLPPMAAGTGPQQIINEVPKESLPIPGDQRVQEDEQRKVELAWDDALDDPLARAGYAIWQAHGIAPSHDQVWEYLSSELQTISHDLEAESL